VSPAQFISRVRGCLSRTPGKGPNRFAGLVQAYGLDPSSEHDCDKVAWLVGEITLDRVPDEQDSEALDKWEAQVMAAFNRGRSA